MRRTSALALTCLILLAACARPVAQLPEAPRPTSTPAPPVELPRDAGSHDALTEWWYVTGHLQAADGRRYGFEFTVFQGRREDAATGYLAHFAVSDIDGGRFSHQARAIQTPALQALPLNVGGWTLDNSTIDAAMQPGPGADPPFRLRLSLADEKPPVLHHGGYIDFGAEGGSYYYSRTRLSVSGTVDETPVSGQAWMDHQWGNFLVTSDLVWAWYSVQLDDRTELMLYVLRNRGGLTYGTYVRPDGSSEDLAPGSVQVHALGSWSSPHTLGVYPSGWQLTLPDGRGLTLAPLLEDQELYFPGVGGMAYWEGAVHVDGDASGEGYVELTGYAQPADAAQ